MRRLSKTRKVLLFLFVILGILEIAGVISVIGEPVVKYSIFSGLFFLLIYELFEAKQEEKNRFYH